MQPTLVYKWMEGFIQAGTRGLVANDTSDRERQLEQENHKLKEMAARMKDNDMPVVHFYLHAAS